MSKRISITRFLVSHVNEHDPNHSARIPRTRHLIKTFFRCYVQSLFQRSFSLNRISEAELNLQSAPSFSSISPSICPLLSSVIPPLSPSPRETTLIHLCVSLPSRPAVRNLPIYLVSPCFAITPPLCNPPHPSRLSIHPSVYPWMCSPPLLHPPSSSSLSSVLPR